MAAQWLASGNRNNTFSQNRKDATPVRGLDGYGSVAALRLCGKSITAAGPVQTGADRVLPRNDAPRKTPRRRTGLALRKGRERSQRNKP